MSDTRTVRITINGGVHEAEVEPRRTLADFIREDAGLKGTHVACEHGFCGNCNVVFDGDTIRSCLMFAVQANNKKITTVEGLASADGSLSVLQQCFHEQHGLQCGFCTPGMLITLTEHLRDNPDPDEAELRTLLTGNLCRCTGYQAIVDAGLDAARRMREAGEGAK